MDDSASAKYDVQTMSTAYFLHLKENFVKPLKDSQAGQPQDKDDTINLDRRSRTTLPTFVGAGEHPDDELALASYDMHLPLEGLHFLVFALS